MAGRDGTSNPMNRFQRALGVNRSTQPSEWLLRLFILPHDMRRNDRVQVFLVQVLLEAGFWIAQRLEIQQPLDARAWIKALLINPTREAPLQKVPLFERFPSLAPGRFGSSAIDLARRLPQGTGLLPWLGVLLLILSIVIAIPLELEGQTLFFLLMFGIATYIRKVPQSIAGTFLVTLALIATFRYAIWRTFQTLSVDGFSNQTFALTLILAESFTWIATTLSFIQTLVPLHRPPRPLPQSVGHWPSVDVYIPTYNEPLDIVRITAYAAANLDWPSDRLKIYILDDGRRDAFRAFAEEAGIGYITRSNNAHAKAGNLNEAMKQTSGDFIAIFDCDHVPVRAFLQMTMGWFEDDPKMALVQTPHHFFSPDPFERNLSTFRRVPNEGFLFNRLIQDGNDLWNATFFCGSCAVLRRSSLEEIGGIAVETVTEDAHTALKLHRLGYNSAYINVPLAAGLATETLSGHIGQRVRWARGMAQIFRIDNPLLGKGLSLFQRLCYANASLHFFFGFPRLIFMTAPIGYLFFELHFIRAEPLLLLMYGLPYLTLANIANHRIQGRFRHSFWAEVYETVLATYIAVPTFLAMVSPKLGRFNVTPKGGLIQETFIDWKISVPYLLLLGLNLIGLGIGLVRLTLWNTFETPVVLMNLFWTTYNLIILGVVFSVGTELRQIRRSHRTPADLPAVLYLETGHVQAVRVSDFSSEGLGIKASALPSVAPGSLVSVGLARGDLESTFHARIIASTPERLSLKMEHRSLTDEANFVACTFSRADAWSSWHEDLKSEGIFTSIAHILGQSFLGYQRFMTYITRKLVPSRKVVA